MKYEYECLECDEIFEKNISVKDLNRISILCPKCGKDNVKKIFFVPLIQFKGSGFYSTDNEDN